MTMIDVAPEMALLAGTGAARQETDEAANLPQARQLILMADAAYELAVSTTGEPIAIPRRGPRVAVALRGAGGLRASLAAAYYARPPHRTVSSTALTDAILVLEGLALASGRVVDLPLRVAEIEGGIVIDLGRQDGRQVRVRPRQWEVISPESSDTVFARTALTSAMPIPVPGGTLDELRALINVTDDSWPLVVGWLVAALMPGWPHPVAFPAGEQGTGKTTCARMLVQLVDPSPSPVRKAPKDEDDWVVAASGSWVVAVDNISTISAWFSDAICRAVTGEGLIKRRLYTDTDLAVLTMRRAIMLTTIDAGALRGDLADRLLTIDLERIPATHRRTDIELMAAFEQARPRILGALLDLLADVLATLPEIELAEAPRMADFARVLAAIDHCRGLQALELYAEQAKELTAKVVESDVVAPQVIQLMRTRGEWVGSATDLLGLLTPTTRPPHGWPATAHVLTGRLRRIAPALRDSGIEFSTKRLRGERRVVLTRVADALAVSAATTEEEPF